MMNVLTDGMGWAMAATGLAAWRTLPVFVVVLVLDRMLRRRVSAVYVGLLWMLVVARLLIPVSLPSPLAVSDSMDRIAVIACPSFFETPTVDPSHETFTFEDANGETLTVRQPVLPIDASPSQRWAASQHVEVRRGNHADESTKLDEMADSGTPTSLASAQAALGMLMVGTWSLGVLFLLLRGLFQYCRFARRLRRCDRIESRDFLDRVLRACDQIGVRRRPPVKEVAWLDAPAVFGLFRPVIGLPSDWRTTLTGERLDWVLRHELAHIRRHDGWRLLVAAVARSAHWFHPVGWIAFSKLQVHVERAADEVATDGLSEPNVQQYGHLLLQYASASPVSRSSPTMGLLSMAVPRGLQDRIDSLARPRPKHRWLTRLAMTTVIGGVALAGLTDAVIAEPPAVDDAVFPAGELSRDPDELSQAHAGSPDGPKESEVREVSIDVRGAIRKARQLQPGMDAERFVKEYFPGYPMTAEQYRRTKVVDGWMTLEVTAEQQAALQERLRAFEKSGPWQVTSELQVFETDVRLLNQFDWSAEDGQTAVRRLGGPWAAEESDGWESLFPLGSTRSDLASRGRAKKVPLSSTPVRATKISRLDSERFLRQMRRDPHSRTNQAPKVTMFNGTSASIHIGDERHFVTDVSVIRGDRVSTVEPKVSILESGCVFHLRPTVVQGEQVDLEMVITRSSIEDVRLASMPRLASNQVAGEVTIQIPIVQSNSLAIESRLGPDEALLVFSPKSYRSEAEESSNEQAPKLAEVFMIRTSLISDHEELKLYLPAEEES